VGVGCIPLLSSSDKPNGQIREGGGGGGQIDKGNIFVVAKSKFLLFFFLVGSPTQ